ncbi:MAG: sugar kinase [Pseudomonadota bacterium]
MVTSPRIGCLGEVMLELVVGAGPTAELGVAGDTYNTSVYLAHAGVDVEYITVLGTDGFSDRIRAHMSDYGVGAAKCFTHPTRIPGLYAIETDAVGERSFTYWRSASAARCLGNADLPALAVSLEGLTHLFYSGISLAILPQENRDRLFAAIDEFRASGGVVAFDSNYRPHLWNDPALAARETERAWKHCDIALPSIDDEMAIFGDVSEAELLTRFRSYGITQGALKRGEKGPIGFGGAELVRAPEVVRPVDTTAAGDSFNAAFLASFTRGEATETALEAGHTLAAEVILHRGAIIFSAEVNP